MRSISSLIRTSFHPSRSILALTRQGQSLAFIPSVQSPARLVRQFSTTLGPQDDHSRRDRKRNLRTSPFLEDSLEVPPRDTPAPLKVERSAEVRKTKEVVNVLGGEAEDAKFDDFPLHPDLLRRLKEVGYEKPFPVQAATFPYSLAGQDLIAKAFTGSGKTLAFTIPIIQKLGFSDGQKKYGGRNPRAIVLSPTRELGLQTFEAVQKISDFIRCLAVYGGASISSQQRELKRGVDIVIGTPGRVNDLIERGDLDLSEVEIFVLDEADQMMGNDFKDQVETIMSTIPATKQTLLFSATMPTSVKHLTKNFMRDPTVVDLLQKNRVPATVTHEGIMMRPGQSLFKAVGDIVLTRSADKAVVFCNTKSECSKLALYLSSRGITCEALHSDLSQNQREVAMDKFRTGKIRVVIATDVAARGIDVPNCDLVIHHEPPCHGFEYYIHRSGRTGRAGKEGTSVVLYERKDRNFLRDLEEAGIDLSNVSLPNEEQILSIAISEEIKKMDSIPSSLVAKMLPEAERIHKEQGVQALAKALILSSKFHASNQSFEERGLKQREEREEFGRGSRDFGRSGGFRNDRDRDGFRDRDRSGRTNLRGNSRGERDWKFEGSDRRRGDQHRTDSFERHQKVTHGGRHDF